ncbi:uncharacterized protein CDAR_12392 [Caerostris darwini]|uniref:Ig-like domain-containing protein n=1 Tax=Caerostris darwini TaxID=1538125 RepID=A0AAV4V2H6_9ARAC|nr:uncharacterized protein CDAR_12392 [Caerostris darwini]
MLEKTDISYLHLCPNNPPREVIIMNENGENLQGIIGPYNEGSSLTLFCEADQGLPALRWWRDDVVLDDFYIVTEQNFSRNKLYLEILKRTDFMVNLTCSVIDNNITDPIASSVIIDMNLKPTEVLITSLYHPLTEGYPHELICLARGARPPAQVTWFLDGKKLKSQITESIVKEENLTQSCLTFQPSDSDSYRNLSCVGENPDIPFSKLEDTWMLEIQPPPEVTTQVSVLEDPPEEPKNCEVTNSSSKCILVECMKDQDEGLEQLFQLDVFDTSSKELLVNITDFNPEFHVCSLPAESSFLLLLYAINTYGESKRIEIHANTTSFDEDSDDDDDNGSEIILITLGASFLLLVLGAAISLYKIRASAGGEDGNIITSEDGCINNQQKAYILGNLESGVANEKDVIQSNLNTGTSTSLPMLPISDPIVDVRIQSCPNDPTLTMSHGEFPLLSSNLILQVKFSSFFI